ncbi:hypothetical protein H257_10165 [Aphanomyces astaci]|uniref:Uncharacterized protein n=1 Tax=Aphanomyces astaci TaxID=112090 RepID=W4G9R6_APHAT|nr:hypothetical protein H257_10165 [Aphanomyces astaci]ETV75799.1 hypothetical protein H257_10165 [Aphanomyces astaci]|eukprot:XP_009834930.1 hypothetical protein H257_10165 [Aphanomyces astaci]
MVRKAGTDWLSITLQANAHTPLHPDGLLYLWRDPRDILPPLLSITSFQEPSTTMLDFGYDDSSSPTSPRRRAHTAARGDDWGDLLYNHHEIAHNCAHHLFNSRVETPRSVYVCVTTEDHVPPVIPMY